MIRSKTVLGSAIGLALAVAGVSAQAAVLPVSEMSITGGTFQMGGPPAYNIVPGALQPIVMGTAQGTLETSVAATSLATFQFGFFGPVGAQTATQDLDGLFPGPYALPSASFDDVANQLTVDLGSWFASWNNQTFNQGASGITGACAPTSATTCSYSIAWSSLIKAGPFIGNTGFWTLTGEATVVPVPAAVWLMGSALLGLAGVARRKIA